MRWILPSLLFAALGCNGSSFLLVEINEPPETNAPAFDALVVRISAEVEGAVVDKTVTFENDSGRDLPVSFSLEFARANGALPVSLSVEGQLEGNTVFFAEGSAQVGDEVTITASFCGDGLIQSEREECDDQNRTNGDGCSEECRLEFCGDGTVNNSQTEQCDDGNNIDNDGCDAQCALEDCGDGVLNLLEECDDGNEIDNDGCDADCTGPDVVQLALGTNHSCALLDTGNVRCWGLNNFGQLGYGNTINVGDSAFGPVFLAGDVPVGGKVTQLSAGAEHTCALLDTGKVRCWGQNTFGQLGYANNTNSTTTPTELGDVSNINEVIKIAAGTTHTCTLSKNNQIQCWGDNRFGQLGYGNTIDIGDNEPPTTTTVNTGNTAEDLSTGSFFTCIKGSNDEIRCWGNGSLGRLGYGNTNNIGDNEIPASAGSLLLNNKATSISSNTNTSCIVTFPENDLMCWGSGANPIFNRPEGILGYGGFEPVGDNETPASKGEINIGGNVLQVSVGNQIICALLTTNNVRCWGGSSFSSFGIGYNNTELIGDDETPASAGDINIGAPVAQIAAGGSHACAILTNGRVRCWGSGTSGRLGYGSNNSIGDDEFPVEAGDVPITGFEARP